MAPPRKKLNVDNPTTEHSASTSNNNNNNSLSERSAEFLSEMPLLVQWKIIKQVVVLSSTAADTDVHFEDVLASLSLVCRVWRDIVTDPYFRKQLVTELVAIDPLQRLRRHSFGVNLLKFDARRYLCSELTTLDDELFIPLVLDKWSSLVSVYDLNSVTQSTRAQPRRRELNMRTHWRRDLPCPVTVHYNWCSAFALRACETNRSLYVTNTQYATASRIVYRISADDGRVLAHWFPLEEIDWVYMTVCRETGRVLVPDHRRGTITEYDCKGRKTRTIDVRETVADLSSRRNDRYYNFNVVASSLSELTVVYSEGSVEKSAESPVVVVHINIPTANGSYVFTQAAKDVRSFNRSHDFSLTDEGLCAVLFKGQRGQFGKKSKVDRKLIKFDVEFLDSKSEATSSRRQISLLGRQSTKDGPASAYFRHVICDLQRARVIGTRNDDLTIFDLLCEELR